MKSFLAQIKQDMESPRNQQYGGRATLVDTRSLYQLLSSFESLDSGARADHDAKNPHNIGRTDIRCNNRSSCYKCNFITYIVQTTVVISRFIYDFLMNFYYVCQSI